MRIDYESYSFRFREILRYLGESLLLAVTVNYMCYRSFWAFLPMLPWPYIYLKIKKKQLIKRRKKELNYAFKDAMNSLSVALKAGYSMENAVTECLRDLQKLYPKESPIVREFAYIRSQIGVSIPVEDLLMDFGERSGVEDIRSFAEIYRIARRSGGNLTRILRSTASNLGDRIEVEKEIETCIAAKKMEQSIMAAVPCGIILYMQISSPGFLDIFYGSLTGTIVMSGCLLVYLAAFWLGRQIVRIEV